jgi:hypothetical protein
MADQAAAAAQNRAGLIAKSPETYKLKMNYQSWLKQFRNYIELLNVPANNIYRTFLSFLDEETFGIVETLNLQDAQRADFFDNGTQGPIREAIKNRQGERIPPEYMLRFRKQHEGESIEKYAAELEKMAQEAFPEDQDIRANRQLIQSFLMGVRNDELGVKLLEEAFDNLTEAVNAAARHCKALQTRRYIRKETEAKVLEKVYQTSCHNCSQAKTFEEGDSILNINDTSIAMTRGTVNSTLNQEHQIPGPSARRQVQVSNQQPLHTQSMADQNQMQVKYNQRNPRFYSAPRYADQNRGYARQISRQYRDKRNIQCYYCNRYGHYQSECWTKDMNLKQGNQQTLTQRPTSRLYCTYCSKGGHTADRCWHLNQPDQNRNGNMLQSSNDNPTGKQSTNPFHQ